MTRRKFRLALYALLSLSLMGAIFYFSSQPAHQSQELSDGLLWKLLAFFGLEDDASIDRYGKLIRKIAHFLEYAALGLSTGLFFTELFTGSITALCRGGYWAGGLCVLYAVSDEMHQYFVPDRSMQLSDVLLDCVGAMTALLFLLAMKNYIYFHREERKNFE